MLVRRSPKCSVSFLGETWQAVNTDSLVSVQTQKSLGQPAGNFRIVLKVSSKVALRNPAHYVDKGAVVTVPDVALNNRDLGRRSSSGIGDLAGDTNFWLNNLRPMMLVRIKFGEFLTGTLPLTNSKIPESLTMLGSIDTVSVEKAMQGESPQRIVIVTGRDLGKLFTDDAHYTFPFPALVTDVAAKVQSNMFLEGNATPEQRQTLLDRYFIRDGESFQAKLINTTVSEAINALYEQASALDVRLENRSNLRDYLPYPLIASDVAPIPFFGGDGFVFMSGSVWSLFEYVVPKPWGEIFVDTVGEQARLIVRRPPWGRTWREQRDLIQQVIDRAKAGLQIETDDLHNRSLVSGASFGSLGSFQSTGSNTLESAAKSTVFTTKEPTTTKSGHLNSLFGWESTAAEEIGTLERTDGMLWPSDEFHSPAGTTRLNQLPYHTIEDHEVLSMSLGRSDREVLNFFFPFPSSSWLQGEDRSMAAASLVPPILDVDSVLRYGMRLFQAENRWWMSKDQPDTGSTPTSSLSFLTQLLLDTVRAFFYFRDNAEYLSGSITIMGRDEIRIGDHVVLNDFNKEDRRLFYVEGVENHWAFGDTFTTTLSVTRGQPLVLETHEDGTDVRKW